MGWLGGATAAAVPRLRQLLRLSSVFGAVARKEWQNALQLKENGPPAPAALGSMDVPSVELGAPQPPPQSCKHTSRLSKAPSKREITPPSSPALPRRPSAQALRIPASPQPIQRLLHTAQLHALLPQQQAAMEGDEMSDSDLSELSSLDHSPRQDVEVRAVVAMTAQQG